MEFWIWFKDTLFPELYVGFLLFLPTLSLVYVSGRMLNILKRDESKNALAIIASYGLSYFYTITFTEPIVDIKQFIWTIFFRGSLCILFYCFIGFRAFDRVDNLLDKKVGED